MPLRVELGRCDAGAIASMYQIGGASRVLEIDQGFCLFYSSILLCDVEGCPRRFLAVHLPIAPSSGLHAFGRTCTCTLRLWSVERTDKIIKLSKHYVCRIDPKSCSMIACFGLQRTPMPSSTCANPSPYAESVDQQLGPR